MMLGDSIRNGVKWVAAGNASHELLHFAISVVLARLLMPADFGLLVTVQIFTGLAGFVAGGGMGQALIQARTFALRDSHVVFTAQLALGIALYALFFCISPWFAHWFNEPRYEDLLRVSALTFLIRPFSNVPNALLHRGMRYKARAFINLGILLVTGMSSISMAVMGLGVWSLVLGGIAGGLTNVLLASTAARWLPRLALDKAVLARLGGYGVKVSLNDVVVYLRNQSSNFVISRFIGTEAVGLYNKAASLHDKPRTMISGSAYSVVFRALATTQDNLDQSKYIYLRTITLVGVYALPVYVGFWWVAEAFITTVYGAHWADAAPVLQILATAGLFQFIGNVSGAVSAARRMLGRELVIQLISWALLLAAIAVGYRWGISGVAWGVVAASFPSMLMMAALVCRELKVRPGELLRALVPALLLNAIMFAALLLAHRLYLAGWRDDHAGYLLAMAAVGAATYAVCFLYLPLPRLAKEAARWKRWLRLPGGSGG